MSVAIKCDRCGKLFEHYDDQGNKVKRIRINYEDISSDNTFTPSNYFDLCPECDAEFKKWMEEINDGRI